MREQKTTVLASTQSVSRLQSKAQSNALVIEYEPIEYMRKQANECKKSRNKNNNNNNSGIAIARPIPPSILFVSFLSSELTQMTFLLLSIAKRWLLTAVPAAPAFGMTRRVCAAHTHIAHRFIPCSATYTFLTCIAHSLYSITKAVYIMSSTAQTVL